VKPPPLLPLLASALASAAICTSPACTNTASLTGGVGGGSNVVDVGTTTGGVGLGGSCNEVNAVQRLRTSSVAKVDLLLMVDNSRSMADKQELLAFTIPELVTGIVTPPCVDGSGTLSSNQPPPTSPCPAGTHRLIAPVFDMHVGLLSSSLGSFGADGCPDASTTNCPNGATSTSNNDHGHLVTRTDPCAAGTVPTWKNEGFLAWDPKQELTPPGLSQIGGAGFPGVPAMAGTLVGDLSELVIGDGQEGCGFESQNESWYRFLVDPSPYQTIKLSGQSVQTSGIDTQLLRQRADFLRSDSLLVIVVVTDETDTSLRESSFFPLFAQELENAAPFHLPTARSECTAPNKGPNDHCCASCGEAAPTNCSPTNQDPVCAAGPLYTDATENLALRAFGLSGGLMSHKARYGIEFFYQPSRYVQALTSDVVLDATGNLDPNPIFSPNPREPGATVRDPSMVLYATITGVPWQLIARQKNGVPDLVKGVSSVDPAQVGGFKTFDELMEKDSHGNTLWDDIVGDPELYVPPLSPFMQESTVPRSGTDPITGIAVAPPSATTLNRINGHEWNIPQPAGDIEYACIFDIPTPRDCSQLGAVCDCDGDPTKDNPLCDPNPNDSGKLTLQARAKAYPGVKNLAIAKEMRDQGIVASICPAQVTDTTRADYGYRPAMKAITDAMQAKLAGQCLPEALATAADGAAECTLIEASSTPSLCDCGGPGRTPIPPDELCELSLVQQDPLASELAWNCFCALTQTSGAALADCQDDVTTSGTTDGWCYIDASKSPSIGNPSIVAACPTGSKREIRFVGQGAPLPGATVFLSCR